MTDISGSAASGVKVMDVQAVILRACKCGQTNAESIPWAVCPSCGRPARIEDQGTVAYWNKNPLMRMWRAMSVWLKGRK